ncbi:kinesin-like protein KIN-10C [Lotus japonicus]|uniref:kinesin-like protein KIN-10C n=1 Tax=Lotus japonicus TaxID=34305 RepID=UPI00258FDE30|nr:kinesin-like protein KIN-10C [Lotus japonicus]
MASTQFDHRKVRVVAKIRGFSSPDANSGAVDWVSVNRESSEDVTISFGKQSSSRYSVDYCYKEHEDNEMIYTREVKPLVSAVFEGHSSTVIAHGARGSGKTHLIQGSTETPGLAVLAMVEFLSIAEKNGKSIAVSFYEVDHQDHAIDLINPEQPPISIFEGRGRIQFKGLTQNPVKSIAEFQNLYCTVCSALKAAPKKGYEYARRSHMGLIVYVFSQNESIEGLVSKMNFVDMAGYEDARKKSSDISGLAETNNINKSIYAVMNVCHALSTNESRVPYRESKLTRMLQDCLRGTGKILLVSCLSPSFCQDSIYMISLASRSCQWIQQTPLGSTMKTETSTKQVVTTHKNQTPLGSTMKTGTSAKEVVTTHKNPTPLGSTMKTGTSAKEVVTTHKNPTPLGSTMKTGTSAKEVVTTHKNQTPLGPTMKTGASAKQVVTSQKNQTPLGSTMKTGTSAKQVVTSRKNQMLKSVSATKTGSSAKQMVTSHKNQLAKSVSATAKKISRSQINEKKATVGLKSAVKGRKLFDEISHSSTKVEKEVSTAHVTKAPELLLENSLLEAGDPVELSSVVEFDKCVMQDNSFSDDSNNDNSCLNASSEVESDSPVENEMDHQETHTSDAGTYSKALSIVQEGDNINKENRSLVANGDSSPPISSQLRELSNSLKMLYTSTPLCTQILEKECISVEDQMSADIQEPKTPVIEQNMSFNYNVMNSKSPWETFSMRGSGMKNSLVQEYLRFLNTAEKEDLKKLKGIGEKRATFILELREDSPEPFKSLDDLKDIGLSAKQIKGIMKKEVGELFN